MEEYPVDFVPLNSTEYVFTTNIKDPEHFFVHVESRSKILDDIMEALANRYNDLRSSDKVLTSRRLGSLCAAKFTDDNNWYRARITGIIKTGMIEVQFVDYGNTDYVSDDRIKALDPDLIHYPVQCYRCKLSNVSCKQGFWTPEETIKFEDKTMDQRCQALFLGKTDDDTYIVEMIDGEGKSLNEMFGGGAKARQTPSHNTESFKEVAWVKGSKVQITVPYVQSPDLFWCQDQSFANELLIMSEELSRSHMTQCIEPLRNVKVGAICAAKFSEDEAWYRGVIMAVSNGAAQVYFVDYGNTEVVPLELICQLSPNMTKMPALAAKCRLSGVSSRSSSWDPSLVEVFEELVVDKEFEMTVVDCQGDTYVVKLNDIVENTDVGGQMLKVMGEAASSDRSNNDNAATSNQVSGIGPSLTIGTRAEVFLSWVDDPGDFWVQLKDFDYLVEKLSSDLQEFYAKPFSGAAVAPGAFIVARYSEDGLWYRGLILKEVSDTKVLVLFLDYGNKDMVLKSDLRQVAPAFGEVVPLAFRCALNGVKALEGEKAWATDAKAFMEELTENGCICEVVSDSESRKLVQLTVNGKDVATELAALRVVAVTSSAKSTSAPVFSGSVSVRRGDRELVTVTHVNSPQEFWCQLNKNIASLDGLMEKLDLHYSDEGGTAVKDASVGRACIAQYSEDQAWYRGSLTGVSSAGYTVQFVDYGNSETVPANLVCEPEPRFLDLPVQAVQCSLSVSGANLADAMTNLTMDKELTMEVLDVKNNLAVVELYDGQSRVSDLLKQSPSPSAAPLQSGGQQARGITPAKSIPAGSTVTAFTSLVLSPSKFFIQLASAEEDLAALMDEIAVQNASAGPVNNPQVGQACIALFSEDGMWYRCIVNQIQGQACKVLFVDYGNEESADFASLRQLPAELASVPIMAYQCSLDGVEGTSWSDEAKQFFESIVMDQELECSFVSQKSVNLKVNGNDLKQELVKNGHFKSKETTSSPQQFGGGSAKPNGFGGSPRKNDSSGFGSGRAKPAFEDSQSGWEDAKEDVKPSGFGSRGGKPSSSGFGGSREGSGFGGSREGSGFGGPREGSGFGGAREGSGFGGGRERKTSTESASGGEFTYPDVPSGSESALLVHIDDDGTFYLQLPSMEKEIIRIARRLAGSYKEGRGPRLQCSPAKGVVCCAKFPVDGCMYRAVILDMNGGNAVLRYVDYGNVEECSTRDLKKLFPDLLEHPVQAFPCKLKGLTWSMEQAEKFASATLDKELDVTFSGSSPPYEVEIKTPDGDLLDILTGKIAYTPKPPTTTSEKPSGFGGGSSSGGGGSSKGFGSSSSPKKDSSGGGFGSSKGFGSSGGQQTFSTPAPPAPKVSEQKYINQAAPANAEDAYICHVEEDGYFFLQLEKDTTTLDSIMAGLDGLVGQHPNISVGAACATLFSEDSSWYRAQIVKADGDNLTVLFVDYGNQDTVKRSSIKPLTNELLKTAPLGYRSQFSDVGPLSEEAQTKLSEYIMEHKVKATFTPGSASPYSVTLVDASGADLQDVVCPSDRYKSQVKPSSVVPAGVSNIEDDGRFFIQMYRDFPKIAELQKTVAQVAKDTGDAMEKLEALEAGQACLYESEPDAWRRGVLLEVTDASAVVCDVDTGKTKTIETSLLFKLPLQLFKSPPFGFECRLKGVESWTEDLRQRFTEMTDDKILNATFYTDKPPYRVSLARSIELDLLGLSAPVPDSPVKETPTASSTTEQSEAPQSPGTEVYISQVNEDGTFYVQLVSQEDDLYAMTEKLEAAVATAGPYDGERTAGTHVCAKYIDEAWYRAEIESSENDEVCIKFLDYGNADTVTADKLRALPEGFEVSVMPAFARKCRLAGVRQLTSDQVESLRDSVVDKVLSMKGEEDVNIWMNGKPLTDMLGLQVAANTVSAGSESYISHVNNDGTFYVQLVSRDEELNTMSEKLEASLAAATETVDLSKATAAGALVCAQYTEDDAWYRAQVETSSDGKVCVRFVDYGNTDTVTSDRLAAVPEGFELSAVPAFARKCRLAGIAAGENLSEEQVTRLGEIVLEKSVTVEGDVEVDVWVDGRKISDVLGLGVGKDGAASVPSSAPQKDEFADASEDETEDKGDEEFTDAVEAIEEGEIVPAAEPMESSAMSTGDNSKLTSGSRVSVTVTYAESPSEFYFQLSEEQAEYNALMDAMYEHFSALPEGEGAIRGEDLAAGAICAALYVEDESWYRAKVLAVADDSYTIIFMDHGNTEVVTADSLRQLPEQFQALPFAAQKALLAGVGPVGDEWSEEAINDFKTMVEEKSLLADIQSSKGGCIVVHLLEMGIPVHQELINKGHAVAKEDVAVNRAVQHVFSDANDTFQESQIEETSSHVTESQDQTEEKPSKQVSWKQGLKIGSVANTVEELQDVSVYVSRTDSPSLFWCQLSTCLDTLSEIGNILGEKYSEPEKPSLSEPASVGHFVVARGTTDGLLYRSKVLQTSGDGSETKLTLQYVDFGTEGESGSNEVYELDAELYKFPSQAFSCGLARAKPVNGETTWSADACEKFSELVRDKELFLKLVGRDPHGVQLVELVDPESNQSLSSALADLGVAVAIAQESMKEGGVQKCSDSSRAVADMSTMLDALEITHPILESTAMVGDETQVVTQPYTIDSAAEGDFRTISLSLHAEYDVTVCNDEVPNCFYVRLLVMRTQLKSLVSEIEEYIASNPTSDNEGFMPKVGDPCLAKHSESWHRALIVSQDGENFSVKLQDSGLELSEVREGDIKHLPAHLMELPVQAIPCYLAGVVSVEPEWCSGAIEFFKDFAKNEKFCVYVMEDGHEGKYGVSMNELDSTGTGSVNRAMVDLGYAEVVPGSNIDVDMEMEKTLDTDMLNDLEESFNEVSLMRCNGESGDEDPVTDAGDVASYTDSYKESDVVKACKKGVDPRVYQLLQVSDQSVEPPTKVAATEKGDGPDTDNQPVNMRRYSLAADVERIETDGCPDMEPSDVEYLAVDVSENVSGQVAESNNPGEVKGVDGEVKEKAETEESKEEGELKEETEERTEEECEVKETEEIKKVTAESKDKECEMKKEVYADEGEAVQESELSKDNEISPNSKAKMIYTWNSDALQNLSNSSNDRSDADIATEEAPEDDQSREGSAEGSHFVSCLDIDLEEDGSPQSKNSLNEGDTHCSQVSHKASSEVEAEQGVQFSPNDTLDEYESCSESGQDEIRRKRTESIRESITEDNLSKTSILSFGEEYDVTGSLLLSGSSFDVSSFDAGGTTLENSYSLTDDSYLVGLVEKQGQRTSRSSSISSLNSTEKTCHLSNTSAGSEAAKDDDSKLDGNTEVTGAASCNNGDVDAGQREEEETDTVFKSVEEDQLRVNDVLDEEEKICQSKEDTQCSHIPSDVGQEQTKGGASLIGLDTSQEYESCSEPDRDEISVDVDVSSAWVDELRQDLLLSDSSSCDNSTVESQETCVTYLSNTSSSGESDMSVKSEINKRNGNGCENKEEIVNGSSSASVATREEVQSRQNGESTAVSEELQASDDAEHQDLHTQHEEEEDDGFHQDEESTKSDTIEEGASQTTVSSVSALCDDLTKEEDASDAAAVEEQDGNDVETAEQEASENKENLPEQQDSNNKITVDGAEGNDVQEESSC